MARQRTPPSAAALDRALRVAAQRVESHIAELSATEEGRAALTATLEAVEALSLGYARVRRLAVKELDPIGFQTEVEGPDCDDDASPNHGFDEEHEHDADAPIARR